MKLATVVQDGKTQLYLESETGLVNIENVAAEIGEIHATGLRDVGAMLSGGSAALQAVRAVCGHVAEVRTPGVPHESVAFAPPVVRSSKIICVGLNYALHAAEGNVTVPLNPLLFAKLPSALTGVGNSVLYPSITTQLDYEGELAVIIGRRATKVSQDDALGYIGGVSIINDISARDLQTEEPQWIRGKSLDTFAPMGPYFASADDVGNIDSLRIQTTVNGEIRQDALCRDMIFKVNQLIAFISEAITLEPGDIIATGTPRGVGLGFTPPRYLQIGDVVEVTITGLGTLRSPIQALSSEDSGFSPLTNAPQESDSREDRAIQGLRTQHN